MKFYDNLSNFLDLSYVKKESKSVEKQSFKDNINKVIQGDFIGGPDFGTESKNEHELNPSTTQAPNELATSLSTDPKSESPQQIDSHIVKCHKCGKEFDMMKVKENGMGWFKCPYCGESVTQIDEITKIAYIRKEKGKYCVKSHKGKNMGCYDTEGEAKERLQQVEMFKHMKTITAESVLSDSLKTSLDDLITNEIIESLMTVDGMKANDENYIRDYIDNLYKGTISKLVSNEISQENETFEFNELLKAAISYVVNSAYLTMQEKNKTISKEADAGYNKGDSITLKRTLWDEHSKRYLPSGITGKVVGTPVKKDIGVTKDVVVVKFDNPWSDEEELGTFTVQVEYLEKADKNDKTEEKDFEQQMESNDKGDTKGKEMINREEVDLNMAQPSPQAGTGDNTTEEWKGNKQL